MLKLYIGNKNYSSWSMRPWVLLKQAGIEFEEVMLRFDSFDADSKFKQTIAPISPTGRVPALVDGDLAVWDTLAIAEYAAEKFPAKNLWPTNLNARATARSVCAEMHSGFTGLRGNCPMNIEAHLSDIGCAATCSASCRCGKACSAHTVARCCLVISAWPMLTSHPCACV